MPMTLPAFLIPLFLIITAACADEPMAKMEPMLEGLEEIMVAGGCFWCVEADLEKVSGVTDVISGYGGGTNTSPTYQNYDDYGHREVALVRYDPRMISFEKLAALFLRTIDVTDNDGQFCDRGHAYSPALYYDNAEQRAILEAVVKAGEEAIDREITLPIDPAPEFFPAEDYHQDYYKKNSGRYAVYRNLCGRDRIVRGVWGQSARELIGY
ncbi:MAG: peptide-methionine (S)-S-oxide reductase MsrA [Pseudomonadota bacterium]